MLEIKTGVYRAKPSVRLISIVIFPIIMILVAWNFIVFFDQSLQFDVNVLHSPYIVGVIEIIFAYTIYDTLVRKLIVKDDRIISVSSFRKQVLLFKNIKGVEAIEYNHRISYYLVSNSDEINISLSKNLENSDKLISSLSRVFGDINQIEYDDLKAKILSSNLYGSTKKERIARLKKARFTAKVYNYLAIGIPASFLVLRSFLDFDLNYSYLVVMLAFIPLIGLFLVYRSHSLIRFNDISNESPHPNILIAVIASVLFASTIGYSNTETIDLLSFGLFVSVFASVFLYLMYHQTNMTIRSTNLLSLLASIPVVALGIWYGWATTSNFNEYLDSSEPMNYYSTVKSKEIVESDDDETYYMVLAPWDFNNEEKKVTVAENTYYRYQENDRLTIGVWSGFLGIRYYKVLVDKED